MARGKRAMLALPLALAMSGVISGCGNNDTAAGPGGVTVGEARALDEAAEMLEQQRLPDVPAAAGANPAPPEAELPAGGAQ